MVDRGEKKKPKKGWFSFKQVFWKSSSKDSRGSIFGLPLSAICHGQSLPSPIMQILHQVANKGPNTVGMLRKSTSVKLVRELRAKLDAGENIAFESVPALAIGALLKDFLRSLPDALMCSAFYPRWMAVLSVPAIQHRLIAIKRVIDELPPLNRLLLSYVLCTLVLIAQKSSINLMSAVNLGVCIGPSLLWRSSPASAKDLTAVAGLVETLITHAQFIFGSNISSLLSDLKDSRKEESDLPKGDDSSFDGLERSPPPFKDKLELRLSRLTMSDPQLNKPEEGESMSASVSHYDPAFQYSATMTAGMCVRGDYADGYEGWEERQNPNFQRQAWFRQPSRRMRFIQKGNMLPAHVHSQSQENLQVECVANMQGSGSHECLLDEPPPIPPRRERI